MERRLVIVVPSEDWGWQAVPPLLAEMPGVQVLGPARSPTEARAMAEKHRPYAVVAADYVSGRSVVAEVIALRSIVGDGCKIVVLATRLDAATIVKLDDLALDGLFLWAELTPATLPIVLRAALQTDMVAGGREVVRLFLAARRHLSNPDVECCSLNDRQRSVLSGLIGDMRREDIADVAGVRPRTVDRVIDEIKDCLGVRSSYAAGFRAAELGLLPRAAGHESRPAIEWAPSRRRNHANHRS